MNFLTAKHKEYWDYRVDEYLPLSEMTDRTWWEILLGCRCQVARKFTYDGTVLWTVWLPDHKYVVARKRFRNSMYRYMLESYSEQTVVFVEAGKQYFDEFDFQIEDSLEDRLAYNPGDDDDIIDTTYEVFHRQPSPVRLQWEDSWHKVEICPGIHKPFRSWNAAEGMVQHIVHELGQDCRRDVFVNGIYKESHLMVWVYTSEDGCNPEGYTRRIYGGRD